MPSDKKILTIAFEGTRVATAFAAFREGKLIIVKMQEIRGDVDEWMPVLQADVTLKVNNGWVVMVDDPTSSFPGDATHYNFNAITEGRTNMQQALDWYFALESRGAIILDEAYERYTIRAGNANSLVDLKKNERGQLQYDVDWMRFSAGHKALLMCVVGACMEEPLSDHWMQAMTGALGAKKSKLPIVTTFTTITKGFDLARAKAYYNAVEELESKKHVRHDIERREIEPATNL